MARSTSELRNLWAPACKSKGSAFKPAYDALDTALHAYSYRPKAGETWGYNCRKITGGSGYSLHAYGPGGLFIFWTGVRVTMALAVDINSRANPYGKRLITDMPRAMTDGIKGIRTNSGHQVWGWGGDYRNNKDAMHFEIVASPAELASGIDWRTVPGKAQAAAAVPAPPSPKGSKMVILVFPDGNKHVLDVESGLMLPFEGGSGLPEVRIKSNWVADYYLGRNHTAVQAAKRAGHLK